MGKRPVFRRFGVVIGFLIIVIAGICGAEVRLDYQDRGDRFEGVRPNPVSGYDLELVSVMTGYREHSSGLPAKLSIQFYLPRKEDVHITVRELDSRFYYWMDRIRPVRPWGEGSGNIFEWSTAPVLSRLDEDMDPYKLIILARLGNSTPGAVERIAPVTLYHSTLPSNIDAYLFILKPGNDARVFCSITPKNEQQPIWQQMYRRKLGGQPFTVRWDASTTREGNYTFRVFGYLLDSNRPIEQVVHFYHKSTIE